MQKTFVLDTNVVLHDPNAIFAFGDNLVILPFSVIEELDFKKREQSDIGRNAREVIRHLDNLRSYGNLAEGVSYKGALLKIEMNNVTPPFDLDPLKRDYRILAVAYNLQKESGSSVILVSKDLNLRVTADLFGIVAQDYNSDKIDTFYSGVTCEQYSLDEIGIFYLNKELPSPKYYYENQFIVMKNGSSSAMGCYKRGIISAIDTSPTAFGLRPVNKEQIFALNLLLDDNIKVVTLIGGAGTGKTLLAVAAGLELVVEQSKYKRLLVTRPIVPFGRDLGALPGDVDDKLSPWMAPIYDSIDFLFDNCSSKNSATNYLFDTGAVAIEPLSMIRGRSIPNQYIIVDEAQNLSPFSIKTIITRVGKGSKIVFTGDPSQIDTPYLDSKSNGLSVLADKIKEECLCGHVTLIKGERSDVAEIGAKLL